MLEELKCGPGETAAPCPRLGLYEKAMPASLTWREKLSAARDAGYDYLEISIDESGHKLERLSMPPEERLALLCEMSRCDMRLETMCLSVHRKYPLGSETEAVRAKSVEILRRAIVLARDIGVRIIQLAGYDEYYHPSNDTTAELFAENLRMGVDYAAQYGVVLAFETMETPFLDTVEKAMYWVKKIYSPYLMIYPDAGNLTNAALAANAGLLCDLRTGAGCIVAMHLKETLPGRFREVPFGSGHVDFTAVVEAALQLGVLRFTGEFWHMDGMNWREELANGNAFLRSHLDAALRRIALQAPAAGIASQAGGVTCWNN